MSEHGNNMANMNDIRFSLGPIQYYWDRQTVIEFYDAIAESEFDRVYLGEVVCSKRRELTSNDWIDLAKHLQSCGKEVVLSTLALLESQSEYKALINQCANSGLLIEANDMSAVHLCQQNNLPFVAGAALNIFNQAALKIISDQGMCTWNPPLELSKQWIENCLREYDKSNAGKRSFKTEIFAFGHLPLAYSARCFTARAEKRPKDDCQRVCLNFPKGKLLNSQEGQQLFVMNGIQTMSGRCHNLIKDLASVAEIADIIRLSPEQSNMQEWLTRFKEAIHTGANSAAYFDAQLDSNGYWHHIPGIMQQ